MLELKSISKTFNPGTVNEKCALHDLSLSVPDGDFVTIIGGSLPGLFSGALITETLFGIRGIGYASYYSMTQADIPFTMFYLAFISILTLLGNLISDLLYAVVDPRVRLN